MYDFAYHKPASVADAVKLLAADPDARPIAGGMTLLPALKQRLNKPTVGGRPVRHRRAERHQRDGQQLRHRRADQALRRWRTSAEVKAAIPALAMLAAHHRRHAGAQPRHHRRQRRQQRPGGGLSGGACWRSARPIKTDKRRIAADDFFQGMFTTALEPGELMIGGRIPDPGEGRLRQDAQPGQPLRHGRRLRGQDGGRRARRGQRRRPSGVFRQTEMETGAVRQLVAGRGRRREAVGRRA